MDDRKPDYAAPVRDTVVIGASAGGLRALRTIVRELPSPFPAVVLIILHIGAHKSALASILGAGSRHPVIEPCDGEAVQVGHVYVAVPDRHLLLEYDRIRLSRGPRENHSRPAIDPLFRSAALTRGPRVIGTLLTGGLDDGVVGLQAIKECGGLVVVQDPATAEAPSMPASALRSVVVDRIAPLASLAAVLTELVTDAASGARAAQQPVAPETARVPAHLSREHAIALGEGDVVGELNSLGRPSNYSCPDCGGTMWQIDAPGPTRFRCHTGHAYSMQWLLAAQSTRTEQALWEAMRALQEKAMMLRQTAELERRAGDAVAADESEWRAGQYEEQARALRQLAVTARESSIA